MPTYDITKLVTTGQLKSLATRVKTEIENAVSNLPIEMFLDQAKTVFVPNFAFSAASYPGATDPNLDGKPVLVLAVKGVDNSDPTDTSLQTTTYSFLNMFTLVDTYTVKAGDSAKILTINGYEVEFHVSAVANNAITVQADGIHVDITGKTDKVAGAVAGNVAGLDASGNLTDAGVAASEILIDSDVAQDTDIAAMITEVFGE